MRAEAAVVLLNPPADEIVIRDNFCSKISQAAYINHPIDLVMQSGFLDTDFTLAVVDAVVEKLSVDDCLDRVKRLKPIAVYALTGSASWNTDRRFFRRLKEVLPGIRLIVSGDIFLENPEERLADVPELDAVLTDFTTPSLQNYLSGKTSPPVPGMIIRDEDNGFHVGDRPIVSENRFTIPVPRHDLFVPLNYRYPFVRKRPFATVMTEYGCPYHCSFCVMGTLGHKLRPVDNVMEELSAIKRLGIRDIFFLDQTFGTDRRRSLDLCDALREDETAWRWLCFSRVDVLDAEMMKVMKTAGCHTIIFGVESADEALLKRYRKGYTTEQVRRAFAAAKNAGIRTVATFILGLPGETWESALKTIDFARSLDCDFASLNVAVPRLGTELRSSAVAAGQISPDLVEFDQSGSQVVMETEQLSREQLKSLKRLAVRKIYLRPGYILRRLAALRSWDEFRIQAAEGFQLMQRYLKSGHE